MASDPSGERGIAVMVQWIRPSTLNQEVPGSNLLLAADVPLHNPLFSHCLVLWRVVLVESGPSG